MCTYWRGCIDYSGHTRHRGFLLCVGTMLCVCELSNILSSQEKLEVIGRLGAIEASPHFEVRALTSTLMIKSHFHALIYCHLKELLHSYSKCLRSLIPAGQQKILGAAAYPPLTIQCSSGDMSGSQSFGVAHWVETSDSQDCGCLCFQMDTTFEILCSLEPPFYPVITKLGRRHQYYVSNWKQTQSSSYN